MKCKKIKRFLISLIIMSLIGLNTIAYAAEEGSTVAAGITPDSILYSADQLFEDLQLAFTTNSEKEAELLLKFAQERLAEAKEMTEEAKVEFVKTAMNAYLETLDMAEEKITEVAADESITEEVKEELGQKLEDTADVDVSIEENLDAEQQEQVEEKIDEVSYTANVVGNLDVEVVKVLREQGMGFGNIAHTIALSELSGKSVEEIASMIEEGQGIGNIAKELGIHPSKMNKKSETAEEEVVDKETIDEATTTEEVTEESIANTTSEGEAQAAVTQLDNDGTKSQAAVIQVQASSVKATSKSGDSTVKDNTSDDDEDSVDKITKVENESNSNEKATDNKEKSDSKNQEKSNKGSKK